MAASAIVASAIQALGELPPVHLCLVAVPAISLSVFAVYSLLSGDNSNPYLTKRGFLHPFVTAEVKAICQVHYRIWNADPIREPATFVDILDLDTSKKPFVDNNWLTEGETSHHEAQKIIMEKWAERRNRLRGWGRSSSFPRSSTKEETTGSEHWRRFAKDSGKHRSSRRRKSCSVMCLCLLISWRTTFDISMNWRLGQSDMPSLCALTHARFQ